MKNKGTVGVALFTSRRRTCTCGFARYSSKVIHYLIWSCQSQGPGRSVPLTNDWVHPPPVCLIYRSADWASCLSSSIVARRVYAQNSHRARGHRRPCQALLAHIKEGVCVCVHLQPWPRRSTRALAKTRFHWECKNDQGCSEQLPHNPCGQALLATTRCRQTLRTQALLGRRDA